MRFNISGPYDRRNVLLVFNCLDLHSAKAGSFQWVMLGGYIISKFMLAILGVTK